MPEETKPKRPRGIARLISGKCIACGGRCQASCQREAIQLNERGEPVITPEKCIGCRQCLKVCPAEALEIYLTPREKEAPEQEPSGEEPAPVTAAAGPAFEKPQGYRGVWVFVEQTGGLPASVSWELLGAGAGLAKQLNEELAAVVIGQDVAALCGEAIACGADTVYLVDNPIYRHYRTQAYYQAVCHLVEKYRPEIVLIGATGLGRDLAGAIATRLKTGLTADCTGLAIDERGFLLQTRPAFGGNVLATILTERTRPQMATVRPHVMGLPPKSASRRGKVVVENPALVEEDFLVKVLEIIEESREGDGVDIQAADIIVSGGRGVQGKENFSLLEELARELHGVVGCSRGTVEAGWMPVERQIGQTGKTVRPKIYFACGISGAIQHLVGMQDSDTIIAINTDARAPIFEVATYGIVGDLCQVVPLITRRLRELRGKESRNPV